jgi:LPS export ABC transporter protein LptC
MRRRWMLVLLPVLAGAAAACQETTPPPPAAPSLADSADQTFYGLRTDITQAGVRQAELRADTGFMFDESTRAELREVHLTFFTTQGVKDAVLTSREGSYNMRTQQMEARGNVVLVSEDGRRLTSEQLRYDQGADQIASDSAFVLVEPGRRLEGVGFRTNSDLTRFQCLSACRGGGAVAIPDP